MLITKTQEQTTMLGADGLARVLGQVLPSVLADHGDLLAVKDLSSGRYIHVNAAMSSFLRRPSAELRGRLDADLFDAALLPALNAAEQTAVAQGEAFRCEHSFEWNGQRRDFGVLRQCVRGAEGQGPWLVSVWHDLAPQRQRRQQLQAALKQIEQQQLANEALRGELADQAMRDPASGLYRRGHFDDQLRREVDLSTREHREFAVVFVELDPDSPEVQALGEVGNDRIFEAMGQLLRSGTRAMDASCRYQGRRFAVLLSGVGLATAHARMESLRRKCASQIVVHEGRELGFSVSMGVASFPHTAQNQEALLQACEAALGEARRRGGNHVCPAAIAFDAG